MTCEHRWAREPKHDTKCGSTLRYVCEACGAWGRVGPKDRPGRPVAYLTDRTPANGFGGAWIMEYEPDEPDSRIGVELCRFENGEWQR